MDSRDKRLPTQGDQILGQLREYDEKKHLMQRSKSSESQIRSASMSLQNSIQMSNSIDTVENQMGMLKISGSSHISELTANQIGMLNGTPQDELMVDSSNSNNPKHEYTSLKIEDIKPRYVPPINFAIVESGLYRSGHPQPINFEFLRTLKLKTIVYLGDKEDNYDYYRWIKDNGINFRFYKIKEVGRTGSSHATDGKQAMKHSEEVMNKVLNLLLNKDNYPVLIHSNKGKHRVGVLVGLVRAFLQGWTLSGAFDEYSKFSREKGEYDLEFVEMFQPQLKVDSLKRPSFIRLLQN